jgi:2'-5' RNA ligase
MAISNRRQLTLFIEPKDSETIEHVRTKFNPLQSAIIKSHVTLCREDEIENIERVLANLSRLLEALLSIVFENAVRFEEGKGALIPSKGDNTKFQALRTIILQGVVDIPRKHAPHITLMHPRNSTCTDEIFDQISKMYFPVRLIFQKISLIHQAENSPWKVIREFDLKNKSENSFTE